MKSNQLGSPYLEKILKSLKPDYWFASHLHVKHSAEISHPDSRVTKFLALDKVVAGREFFEIIDIDSNFEGNLTISHDLEWLALVRLSCIKPDLIFADSLQDYQVYANLFANV